MEQDDAQALKWYFEAAKQANPEGTYGVGDCYENGRGVGKDMETAFRWYYKASCLGYPKAYYKVGCYYASSVEPSADTTQWFKTMRKALEKKAEHGDAEAQYYLGKFYASGYGVRKDYRETFKWFLKAAGQGYAPAEYELADCYEDGKGTTPNHAEALKWCRTAAEHGLVDAQVELGRLYKDGDGVGKDYAEALKWYRLAAEQRRTDKDLLSEVDLLKKITYWEKMAEQGDIEAILKLAAWHEKGDGIQKDLPEAVKWYRKAADLGDAEAQFELAKRFETGSDGVTLDVVKAAELYLLAAEQGLAGAQYAFAECCFNGRGISANKEEAVKWYRKAAEQGNGDAQLKLARCYENGVGVNKDDAQSAAWYIKAAEQGQNVDAAKINFMQEIVDLFKKAELGDAEAQLELAKRYEKGIGGVNKDYDESAKWYRKAAKQGNAEAQFRVGIMFYNGEGVNADPREAVKWYRKAAEQGNAEAQYELALCYYNGNGVTKDLSKALNWYRKAAEQGHAEAQYDLGVCYEEGYGVTQNLSEAFKWYRKAAEQGHVKSLFAVGECYYKGRGVPANDAEAVRWYRKAVEQNDAEAQFGLGVLLYDGFGRYHDKEEGFDLISRAAAQGNQNAVDFLFAHPQALSSSSSSTSGQRSTGGSVSSGYSIPQGNASTGTHKTQAGYLPSIKTLKLANGVELTLVKVEAGTFTMGAKDGENAWNETEHQVSLKHDFYVGRTEVTQEQWNAVMSIKRLRGSGTNMPVDNVSWDEALAFCRELNKRFAKELPDGYRFDLPTEAQWEYAARGGNKSRGYKYSGSNNVSDVAWYNAGSNHPVGTKRSNELGLYDMSGNVWEWCRDKYAPSYAADPEFLTGNNPVNSETLFVPADFGGGSGGNENYIASRGGSRARGASECRVSNRVKQLSSSHYDDLGFRLAIVPGK